MPRHIEKRGRRRRDRTNADKNAWRLSVCGQVEVQLRAPRQPLLGDLSIINGLSTDVGLTSAALAFPAPAAGTAIPALTRKHSSPTAPGHPASALICEKSPTRRRAISMKVTSQSPSCQHHSRSSSELSVSSECHPGPGVGS